jgi:hypothetical protein
MAPSDTLNRSAFMNLLPIGNQSHWLPDQAEYNRTGSGEQLGADLGERLWQGEIEIGRMTRAEAGQIEVLVDLINQPGRAFHVYDSRRSAPRLDPLMTGLTKFGPVIHNLPGADPRELQVSGPPADYVLSPGDYLSFSYGSSPQRFGLHRVVSGVATVGTGTTPLFEVTPAIKPGATVGTAVTFYRPYCRAVIVAGSVQPTRTRATISEGLRFAYVQTVR